MLPPSATQKCHPPATKVTGKRFKKKLANARLFFRANRRPQTLVFERSYHKQFSAFSWEPKCRAQTKYRLCLSGPYRSSVLSSTGEILNEAVRHPLCVRVWLCDVDWSEPGSLMLASVEFGGNYETFLLCRGVTF